LSDASSAADWTTTLLDPSSTSLPCRRHQAPTRPFRPSQQRCVAGRPDAGRPISDALRWRSFAVTDCRLDRRRPADADRLATGNRGLDRTALPGPVGALVSARRATPSVPRRRVGRADRPVTLQRGHGEVVQQPHRGTTYDETRDRLAIAPTAALDRRRLTTDRLRPRNGRPDQPDASGFRVGRPGRSQAREKPILDRRIAFDASGNALIARNWVRSLARRGRSPRSPAVSTSRTASR